MRTPPTCRHLCDCGSGFSRDGPCRKRVAAEAAPTVMVRINQGATLARMTHAAFNGRVRLRGLQTYFTSGNTMVAV